MLAFILFCIIVLLIGLIIGIYVQQAIKHLKRNKPPNDELGSELDQIINWVERGDSK